MNRRMAVTLVLAGAFFLLPALRADVVILKSGTRVEGEIVEETENSVTIVLDNNSTLVLEKKDLESMERKTDEESPLIIEDLLVTPPPKRPGSTPAATEAPDKQPTPEATEGPETAAPPARSTAAQPLPPQVGWSLESLLPKSLQESGAASAVLFGGLLVLVPFLSLGLWGMAYVVKIEEPTILKSFSSVLAAMGIFFAGYLALHALYPQAELDSYLIIFVVTFVLSVVVAQAVYKAGFLQAFLLWALPIAIVAAVSSLIQRVS